MTRTTNARIAGFTYLFYAAIGICSELLTQLPQLVAVSVAREDCSADATLVF